MPGGWTNQREPLPRCPSARLHLSRRPLLPSPVSGAAAETNNGTGEAELRTERRSQTYPTWEGEGNRVSLTGGPRRSWLPGTLGSPWRIRPGRTYQSARPSLLLPRRLPFPLSCRDRRAVPAALRGDSPWPWLAGAPVVPAATSLGKELRRGGRG